MAAKILNPILPEHREAFKEYLKIWQAKLGLQNWRINFSPRKAPIDVSADVQCFTTHRMAKVRLGSDWGAYPPTPQMVESFAVHELLHVLLYPLTSEGLEGEALEAAEHQVIHTLQKLLTNTAI